MRVIDLLFGDQSRYFFGDARWAGATDLVSCLDFYHTALALDSGKSIALCSGMSSFSPSVLDGVRDGYLNGLLDPKVRRVLFEPDKMITAAVSAT